MNEYFNQILEKVKSINKRFFFVFFNCTVVKTITEPHLLNKISENLKLLSTFVEYKIFIINQCKFCFSVKRFN